MLQAHKVTLFSELSQNKYIFLAKKWKSFAGSELFCNFVRSI